MAGEGTLNLAALESSADTVANACNLRGEQHAVRSFARKQPGPGIPGGI